MTGRRSRRDEAGGPRLDRQAIEDAVVIQQRCYRLLRWVEGAIERGFIRFDRVHEYASDGDSAARWIAEHYDNLPPDCRPAAREGEALERFASYFTTYVKTSFELVRDPGKQLKSHCHCPCWMCVYLGNAPHLQMKKLSRAHKSGAVRLEEHYLGRLLGADSQGLAARLLADGELSRSAAIATYGEEMLRRCRGASSGPAVLALWRQFAWTPAGSPDKKFELTAELILDAERELVAAARAMARGEASASPEG